MIELAVNQQPYTDFTSASVTLALDALSNDFSFTASAVGGYPPFRTGDSVQCYVDGEQVLDGYIDGTSGNESEGNHLITYIGRDRTQDFVDSDINVINDIRAGGNLTLKQIIEIVIKNIGSSLVVVEEFTTPPFNEAEDIIAPKVGQNAFDFVNGYARKRQALLTSNANGDIVITSSESTFSGQTLQSDGKGNDNIIDQSWTTETPQRFNTYINRGQQDPIALNAVPDPDKATIQSQDNQTIDGVVRFGRQKVTVESKGYSNEQLKLRSEWSKQLADAQSTKFNCVVRDHSKINGKIWAINELTLINSLAADITQYMLANVITFSESEGQPTTTAIEFVQRDVYTIESNLASQNKTGSQQDAFTSA